MIYFEFFFNLLSLLEKLPKKSATSRERVTNLEIQKLVPRKTKSTDKKKQNPSLKIRHSISFFQGQHFQTLLNAFIANVTNLSRRQWF